MSSSTTDRVKGAAKEVAGKVKEEIGRGIGNPNLEGRGTTEKAAGKVERKVGDVKKVFGKQCQISREVTIMEVEKPRHPPPEQIP